MIRMLIADDHPLIRIGLRAALEQIEDLAVVGEVNCAANIPDLCHELSPDVLLIDLGTPETSQLNTVRSVIETCPSVKIITLTACDDEFCIRNLVGLGVSGYILKDEPPESLIRAIRAALEGDTWFSRRVIDILATPTERQFGVESGDHLTEREVEILRLLVKGRSNSQIAETLSIVEGTVKNHLVNIYQKLDVRSRAEAIAWFIQHEVKQ